MNPFWFFFSYARLDRDPYLKKFYDELVKTVRMHVGGTLDRVGFRDAEDIEPGEAWPSALGQALQTARVFVPIYTPSYFVSEYCGKEWQVIESRRRALPAAPPVILPVLWVPEDKLPSTLPEVVSELQYSHEQLGDLYVKEGLWQLWKLKKHGDARREIVDKLADRIIQVARDHALPPLPELPSIKQVASAFHSRPAVSAAAVAPQPAQVGPRYVQFIFVAGRRSEFEARKLRTWLDCYGPEGGLDWRPYLPELTEEIAILAQGVAASEKLRYEPVPLDADLIQRLKAARKENKIVAIVVDTWTLQLEQYQRFMREYDEQNFHNSVVLIPWNLNNEETRLTEARLRDAVAYTFVNRCLSRDPGTFVDTIRSAEDLKVSLATALNTARMRILSVAEVQKRAESQQVIAKPVLQN